MFLSSLFLIFCDNSFQTKHFWFLRTLFQGGHKSVHGCKDSMCRPGQHTCKFEFWMHKKPCIYSGRQLNKAISTGHECTNRSMYGGLPERYSLPPSPYDSMS